MRLFAPFACTAIGLFLSGRAPAFELSAEPSLSADGLTYTIHLEIDGLDPAHHRVTFRRREGDGSFEPAARVPSAPPFRDEGVPPGRRLEYEAEVHLRNGTRLARESVRARTPDDWVLEGQNRLDGDRALSAGRVLFRRGSRLTTTGHRLRVRALRLESEDGELRSWSGEEGNGAPGETPQDRDGKPVPGASGQAGRPGKTQGEVVVLALRASGLLRVALRGGNGGDGGAGAPGKAGDAGSPGEGGSYDVHPERGYLTRIKPPTNGGPGGRGGDGGAGGKGGDSGGVRPSLIFVASQEEFHCLGKAESGAPGRGGPPGEPGAGGAGGPPGACPAPLTPASPGPRGPDGSEGRRGADGARSPAKLCVRIGEREEGDCES